MKPLKILVTGDRARSRDRSALPLQLDSRPVEWLEVPVLTFKPLPVAAETLQRLADQPADWIFFTSPRAVRFWGEAWMEMGNDFPTATQVACIGDVTAEAASQDGFTADFCPSEPGSEKFLEEFEAVLADMNQKPRIVIPMAQGGWLTIAQRLSELGCAVEVIPLYRSEPRADVGMSLTQKEVAAVDGFLFTSPSSVEAFLSHFQVGPRAKVFAIGSYTESALVKHGLGQVKKIPGSDINRIKEVW